MTISTTASRAIYNGNGVSTEFSVPFKFFADGDITVYTVDTVTNVTTAWANPTDYSLTGAGNDAGGTLTAVTAPATGTRLVINRDMAAVQETDYVTGGAFPAAAHEAALDRLTMLIQQAESALDRTVSMADSDEWLDLTLPAAAPGQLIGWSHDGTGLSNFAEVGRYRGIDATTTTVAYVERDIIKSTDSAQLNNVYICVADSTPGDLLTDTDHFALLVDAVSAATSAANAAASEANTQTIYDNFTAITVNATISTADPSGGSDGDIWYKVPS